MRELFGVLSALGDPVIRQVTLGKVVRINMDSKVAVKYIVSGGGKVPALCQLTKEIWRRSQAMGAELHAKWVRREDRNMRIVDALSKSVTFAIESSSISELEALHGCPVIFPDFNVISNTIGAIVTRGKKAVVIVPRWEAKSWWPVLVESAEISLFEEGHVKAVG